MTPQEFNAKINDLFSHHRSPQKAAAKFLAVKQSTVWRYANGKTPVPRAVEHALNSLEILGEGFFE